MLVSNGSIFDRNKTVGEMCNFGNFFFVIEDFN